MADVIIDEHALKHGVLPEDIAYVWENYVVMQYRGAPKEGEVVVFGYDRKGRPVELVAADRSFGTVVFHANTPPSASILMELGLARR